MYVIDGSEVVKKLFLKQIFVNYFKLYQFTKVPRADLVVYLKKDNLCRFLQ